MKIYTPVKNATGVWCNVHFQNGVGETDDPHLIEWFRSNGYKIEESIESDEDVLNLVISDLNDEIKTENGEIDFESMTPNELRDWARANGFGGKIKNIRNKEKLIEIIRG